MHGEMVMSGGGQAILNAGLMASQTGEQRDVESRFGRITINPAQSLFFPTGLLGMPGKMEFCLARFPSEKYARFSILQSVEDTGLAFITLPLALENPIIEQEDIAQAAADLSLPLDDILPLLIVSVHRDSGGAQITVNARAPLLVRVSLRLGAQYVFPHTKYEIRQPLSL